MNSKFRSLLCLGLFLPAAIRAEENLHIQPAKPQNGVYVTSTGLMKTVIELKDGRFRYWFESDAKLLPEPAYPLEGSYSVQGNTIKLDHEKVFQKEWTFRSVEGIVTLWRPDALKSEASGTPFTIQPLGMANFKRCGAGSVLVDAHASGEEAWTSKRIPIVGEEKRAETKKADGK